MLLLSIIAYLLVTILIGYLASRRVKTSGDFMLAGRSLPIMLSTAALFATWFGSETVFGASSQFLEGGLYAVIEDPFGAALCLLLFGLVYARPLYRMNLLTLGDFFKVRYGKRTEFIAAIFIVPSYLGYIAAQLVAMGLILNVVTGMDTWIGVTISAFVVTFYTYTGGMWAISITDFIQGILIVVGLAALAWVMSDKAGGTMAVLGQMREADLRFLPKVEFYEIVTWLAAWSVLGLGSIPSQDVFQRVMSSGSESTAIRSCFYAAGLYLTVAMLPLFISLCTKQLYPAQLDGDTQLTLPRMVLEHTGLGIQVVFFGSLLSAIMSTTSSAILAPAAILSENIIKPMYGAKLGDDRLLMITRISVLLFSLIATVMACLRSNIYELVGESAIVSLVSLVVPLTLGIYWTRATAAGAVAAMFTGITAWVVFKFVDTGMPELVPATLISLITQVVISRWQSEKLSTW
ncbi:MAG: sodium:solute symporter family protein [Bacteroidota bacterium]